MHAKATGVPLALLLCLIVIGLGGQRRDLSAQVTNPERVVVRDVELLGQASIPIGLQLDGTEIGGLSALTYDPLANVYYVLSDDRSERDPARYYTVTIDLEDGILSNGDVSFEQVTTLRQPDNQPFPPGGIDPEGIALSPGGTLFIASEGALLNLDPVEPFVNEFDLIGRQFRAMQIPVKFLPDDLEIQGVRNNLSFESITLEPAARYVYAAVENSLLQDGPIASPSAASLSRMIRFDRITGAAVQEVVYPVGPSLGPVSADIPHGLAEIVSLDNDGTFLTLERGPAQGFGLAVQLYQAKAQSALDVSDLDDLVWDEGSVVYEIDNMVQKELLLDFAELGLPFVNNFEGMTLGPVQPDGRQILILVSDNNFSLVPTEFIALALTLDTIPAAEPSHETPAVRDDGSAPAGTLVGESIDPAIWLHPENSSQSMVVLTLKNGGLLTLDLEGNVLQQVAPAIYGAFRFNNADIVYNFPLGRETADLVVVSNGQSDSLVAFRIDPETRQLTDITSGLAPATLFGPDDGVQTANRLAIYPSPRDGTVYAFVTQDAGNLVAQVRLTAGVDGLISGEVVRLLELPVSHTDPADSTAASIVVDRFLGHLYIGLRGGQGILKFGAEPDSGNDFTILDTRADSDLPLDIGGLAIYYGAGSSGYVLTTNPEARTFAVYERSGNSYIDSFTVPGSGAIDQTTQSEGIEVSNVALGSQFPSGLVVVHDSSDDPQSIVAEGSTLRNISSNFKFVEWDAIASALPNNLIIDTTTYNPRSPMRLLLPVLIGD